MALAMLITELEATEATDGMVKTPHQVMLMVVQVVLVVTVVMELRGDQNLGNPVSQVHREATEATAVMDHPGAMGATALTDR